jgi:hypothetical protein
MPHRTRLHLVLGLSLLGLAAVPGCQVAGWVAHGLAPDKAPEEVQPEYQGLVGKTVAVMVAADERTLSQFPDAPNMVCQYVTSRLAVEVRGIKVMDPKQIAKFTRENPDWIAIPYGDLARELRVDRIVHVSLAQYSTHEQGNRDIWQGNLVSRVGVLEADAKDPHNFAYVSTQSVQYPPDNPVGLLRSDDGAIQRGMNTAFADRLGAIFREAKPKN